MFRLLPCFSLTGLISIAAAAIILGALYRDIAVGDLSQAGERNNIALTGALSKALKAHCGSRRPPAGDHRRQGKKP